jgi:SAM-dependent methyltransferase
MNDEVEALLAEQIAYYRAHAPDYDNEYLGQPWDRCIDELPITGDVLELACGTGHWTPLLAALARSMTAIDVAPEMLTLARQRVGDLPVEFIQADLFGWQPPRRYDTVFFAFWLTHVPPGRFAAFAMAASTGWSRCSIRPPSLPPGSPSWAGRQASARPASASLSAPPANQQRPVVILPVGSRGVDVECCRGV